MPSLNDTANAVDASQQNHHSQLTQHNGRTPIIGSGNMATAIRTRAAKHGHTIELIRRTTAKAQALADQIGNGATEKEPQ